MLPALGYLPSVRAVDYNNWHVLSAEACGPHAIPRELRGRLGGQEPGKGRRVHLLPCGQPFVHLGEDACECRPLVGRVDFAQYAPDGCFEEVLW